MAASSKSYPGSGFPSDQAHHGKQQMPSAVKFVMVFYCKFLKMRYLGSWQIVPSVTSVPQTVVGKGKAVGAALSVVVLVDCDDFS